MLQVYRCHAQTIPFYCTYYIYLWQPTGPQHRSSSWFRIMRDWRPGDHRSRNRKLSKPPPWGEAVTVMSGVIKFWHRWDYNVQRKCLLVPSSCWKRLSSPETWMLVSKHLHWWTVLKFFAIIAYWMAHLLRFSGIDFRWRNCIACLLVRTFSECYK